MAHKSVLTSKEFEFNGTTKVTRCGSCRTLIRTWLGIFPLERVMLPRKGTIYYNHTNNKYEAWSHRIADTLPMFEGDYKGLNKFLATYRYKLKDEFNG